MVPSDVFTKNVDFHIQNLRERSLCVLQLKLWMKLWARMVKSLLHYYSEYVQDFQIINTDLQTQKERMGSSKHFPSRNERDSIRKENSHCSNATTCHLPLIEITNLRSSSWYTLKTTRNGLVHSLSLIFIIELQPLKHWMDEDSRFSTLFRLNLFYENVLSTSTEKWYHVANTRRSLSLTIPDLVGLEHFKRKSLQVSSIEKPGK